MAMTLPIVEHQLDNGLRVFVVEDRTAPLVAVNLWYNVGSRHEASGKTGFAHLFEHVMFQGSANVGTNEHMALMNAVGANLNATTSFDRTNYFETVPTGALELALWLEADRMGTLLDALSQENLDNQRDVVQNERRERYDNQPYGTSWEHLFAMAFPEGHHYAHLPIGSMADLNAASLDDAAAFFTTHYHPGNAVLTMAGDVDPATGFELAKRHFGGIDPKPAAPPGPNGAIGPRASPVRHALRESVPAEAYYALYRAPADGTAEVEALDIAARILGGGTSSRLHARLVRQEQLAQAAQVALNRLIGGASAVTVAATARRDADLDTLEETLLAEIDQFAEEGPSDDELEIAKAQMERQFLDATSTCAGLADAVSGAATLFGDPLERLGGTVERIAAVTAEEVHRAVRTWLPRDSRAVLTYRLDPIRSLS